MLVDLDPTLLDRPVLQLFIATVLGLFLGLEREWSEKAAGVRTFSLIALLGGITAVLDSEVLLILGGVLVIAHATLLAIRGIVTEDIDGLSLTTSVSMLVTYSLGVLVVEGFLLEAVVVAVLSSLLLVLRRELHQFAGGLSKPELRSAAEFAIIAFVVFPLLPTESYGPWEAIQPRLVWSLVVAISAIGFVNYILVRKYQGRGLIVTGFFGGLVNSTAVIAELAARSRDASVTSLVVSGILLANAAMALRNALIVVLFIPEAAIVVGIPLGAITVTGLLAAVFVGDLHTDVEADLTSPFSLQNALVFGALFLGVLVISAGAEAVLGASGFLSTTFLAGLVSSGTATTTAVSLLTTGQVAQSTAVAGVLAGTTASILVKIALAGTADRQLVVPVFKWCLVLILVGAGAALIVL